MKLRHHVAKFLTHYGVAILFVTNLCADNLNIEDISISNRGGNTTVGGSVSLASMGGGMHLGSTSFGATYSTGESGRSLGLQSTFSPPSLMEAVRLGTLGIDPMTGNTALAMHIMTSAAILQATAKDRFDAAAVVRLGRTLKDINTAAKVGAPSTTTGRISFAEAVIRDFKAAHGDDAADKGAGTADGARSANPGSAPGEPPEDPEDDEKDLLHNDLCNREQMGEPGKIIFGGGSKPPFRDADKFAQEFGGGAADWVKKVSNTRVLSDGKTWQVRWVENIKTGQRVNFKTKMMD
jgi:hypothetical protein